MNTDELLNHFKSPAHAYAFAFEHLEGQVKLAILGVTREHFRNRTLADGWLHQMTAALPDNAQGRMDAAAMHQEMIAR
jgi:hypothetical protein